MRLLPRSHAVFANLKSWLRGTFHGVSRKHLPRYLDEFVYRFNERGRELELGALIVARALQTLPLPYHRLIAEQSA